MTDSSVTEAAPVIGADLSDLDISAAADAGSEMEVRHPHTNEVIRHADGRPWTITLLGKDSDKFLNIARAQSDRRIANQMRTKQILTSLVEKDEIELLVGATIKWDITKDGQPAKCDPNEYRKAYTKFRWMKEQADEFIGNRGNFLKR